MGGWDVIVGIQVSGAAGTMSFACHVHGGGEFGAAIAIAPDGQFTGSAYSSSMCFDPGTIRGSISAQSPHVTFEGPLTSFFDGNRVQ